MPETPTIPSPTDTGAPDWSTIPDQITCPLCSYDLRGLSTPRCPECGYAFDWPTVLSARRNVHPSLFEHHGTLTSLALTLLSTLLPRRFWRRLTASHLVHPGRLRVYRIITLALPLLPLLIWFGLLAYYINSPAWGGGFTPRLRYFWQTAAAAVMFLTWPSAMLLMLMVYRRSMWKASVRTDHLRRCVTYSWDATAWVGLAGLALIAIHFYLNGPNLNDVFILGNILTGCGLLAWHLLVLIASYRLATAYHLYLRMRRAWLAIPLASLAVLLFYWVILIQIDQAMSGF